MKKFVQKASPMLLKTSFFSLFTLSAFPLVFNLYSVANGKGLELDQKILKKELEALKHEVRIYDIHSSAERTTLQADVNLFLEILNPDLYPKATLNLFIPNPEWYVQNIDWIRPIDWIICRTRSIEKAFNAFGKGVFYLGFTSNDTFRPIPKDYHQAFHLVGGSCYKGTPSVIQAWANDANLPSLTCVHHLDLYKGQKSLSNLSMISTYLPKEELLRLQNHAGIHVCPSEAEGYGHSILEAMSQGAVVLTTDAPPMNEFIQDPRCLVPFETALPCFLGVRFLVSPKALTQKIKELQALPESTLIQIGQNNRKKFLELDQAFKQNLVQFIEFLEKELEKKKSTLSLADSLPSS